MWGEKEACRDHDEPGDDAAERGLHPARPVDRRPAERRSDGEGPGERPHELADAQSKDLLRRVNALCRC